MTSFSCFSETQPGGGAGMFSGVPGGIKQMTNNSLLIRLKRGPCDGLLLSLCVIGVIRSSDSQQGQGKQTNTVKI